MSDIQRIIKYLAIGFAIYLVVVIISGIVSALGGIFFIFGSDKGITEDLKSLKIDANYDIDEIEIDIKGANLIIEESEEISIETNNSYIETHQSNNKLVIKEKNHNLLKYNNESKLVIHLPVSTNFEKFNLKAGAGKIDVYSISAKDVNLELGAGQVIINNLEAEKKAKINGGAGEMIIKNGKINNLDFDMGVGRAEIKASILGNSDIESGVGELAIKLLGSENDYEIEVDKGIGNIQVDGKNIGSNSRFGNGSNKIDIDGGVGKVTIDFISNEEPIENKENNNQEEKATFTRTYKVLNKTPYEEKDSYYLTLQVFQGEVDTVVVKNFKENIEEGKTYEFTFEKTSSKKDSDSLKSIFSNYKLVEVKVTNKVGTAQRQDAIN